MGRKKQVGAILEDILISDASSDGNGVGKHNDKVVFIKYGVPGDVVDVKIVGDKKRFLEASILKLKKKSENRTDSFCSHFGVCGGCKWQNLSYVQQLFYKEKQVKDAFQRIGKLEWKEWYPIKSSEKQKYYRNKLEFTFSQEVWLTSRDFSKEKEGDIHPVLGYHAPGRFDKVLPIENCFLMDDLHNEIRNETEKFALENNFSFFHIKKQEGWLRNLVFRFSSTGQLMLIYIFHFEDEANRNILLNHILQKFPQITSLLYIINEKKNDSYSDLEAKNFFGNDFLEERMEDLTFRVGPKSFYQTNSQQAYELYKIARDFANITENDLVYDLYTGTGTIANFVAKKAKKVIGIEYIDDAIRDAKINSEINNITNTDFFAGDMKNILTSDFIASHGKPDIIITDPPRAGMHEDVIQVILNCAPEKIVYVSCNPATQARDIDLMRDNYKIEKVQPVDMFPHTHHVENVVLLTKI